MPIRLLFFVLVGLLVIRFGEPRVATAEESALPFSCEVFGPYSSEADLRARFGTDNVKTALVPWGGAEGDYNEGTVLFGGTPEAKLEIYWRDAAGKRLPQWVSVRGKHTRWRSPRGVTLGTSLRTIETLNRRPFRILGFGSDGGGTVMSWSGGALEGQDSKDCRVRMRVAPSWDTLDPTSRKMIDQLHGERDFSSGHPAMRSLDPAVNELFLQYVRHRPMPVSRLARN
jgi:hypothetical protein